MLERIRSSGNYVLKKLETNKEPKYYALNIKNGDCHEVNEVAYDDLLMIEENLSKRDIFLKLKSAYENLTKEVFDNDYENLVTMGLDSGILIYG